MAFPPTSGVAPAPPSGLVRANGRAAEIVFFEESLVAFFAEAAELLGIPRSIAAIYGVCFASPEPLSFSEIHDRLEMSSGSVSQGLRILREVGALKAVNGPDRRDRFEPDLELRKLVTHYLGERLEKQLDAGRGSLQAVGKALPRGRNGSARVLRERLKVLQNWHDKTRAILPLVKTFLNVS
jgi:HTH-type transcriptional regulator, glycine betaine synthesis regulator